MLKVGQTITDPFSLEKYRIEAALGTGGFAETYRAERLTASGRRRPRGTGLVCVKIMTDPEPWHGEAYFGLLTRNLSNVVRHRGSFALKVRSGMRYVLLLELQSGGTVRDWIAGGRGAWTAAQVTSALRPLSRSVDALHMSGATHRDITPANVFVGARKSLRLGDFGIARHGLRGRGPRADQFNADFVATSLRISRNVWRPSDDVYQLALLGLSLLLGEEVTKPDWRSLRHRITDENLRAVLHRATGPGPKRYATAGAFARDLAAISGGPP